MERNQGSLGTPLIPSRAGAKWRTNLEHLAVPESRELLKDNGDKAKGGSSIRLPLAKLGII